MSHPDSKKLSADGYLGNKLDPLKDEEVPKLFSLKDPGTMIVIPGYISDENDEEEDGLGWEQKAINAASDSFFFALIHKRLELTIGKYTLDAKELSPGGSCWEMIQNKRTLRYIEVSAGEPVANTYIQGIGDLSLRIDVGDGNERRSLALVRHPGLMLTDVARNLGPANPVIPNHWDNFTAVLSCVPRDGDLILKKCEPPSHDALSVSEIPQTDKDGRRQAREALKAVKDWLYKRIKEKAESNSREVSDAHELERYGLVIENVDLGTEIGIDPLRTLNRAPRFENLSSKKFQEEDVEEGGDSGTEQPSPFSGEGKGGNRKGSRVQEDSIKETRKPSVELSPIFRQVKGETHKLVVSISPPEPVRQGQDMRLALRVVGEDESSQIVGLMSASIYGRELSSVEKNIFVIPQADLNEIIRDGRIEIELLMNEPVGVSSFNLAYVSD